MSWLDSKLTWLVRFGWTSIKKTEWIHKQTFADSRQTNYSESDALPFKTASRQTDLGQFVLNVTGSFAGWLTCRKSVCEVSPPTTHTHTPAINSCENTEVFMGAGKRTQSLRLIGWPESESELGQASFCVWGGRTASLSANLKLFPRSEEELAHGCCRTELRGDRPASYRGEWKRTIFLIINSLMTECTSLHQ